MQFVKMNILKILPVVREAEVVVGAKVEGWEAFAYNLPVGRFVVVLSRLLGGGTLLVVQIR